VSKLTAQETALLVGAIVGLMAAVQAWLATQAVAHGKKLDDLSTRAAHIADLQSQLDKLTGPNKS